MRVLCERDNVNQVADRATSVRLQRSIRLEGGDPDLDVGRVYAIEAIEERDGGIWFFIHVSPELDFPVPFPAEFFRVVDGEVPHHWHVTFRPRPGGDAIHRIAFRAWALDDRFYERLIDGDDQATAEYSKNRTTR